jgi:hypothetical protein
MIKNEQIAGSVSQVLQDACKRLGDSILQVNATCSEAESAIYRHKIGDVFYILAFGILEPLYEEHPQLKPPDWDDREA